MTLYRPTITPPYLIYEQKKCVFTRVFDHVIKYRPFKEKNWLAKISLLLGLFIFQNSVYANDAPTLKATNLITKAQNEGQVRVIVTLKIPKYFSIAHVQEQVIKRLQANKEKILAVNSYRFTPQIALSVTASGLKSLMFDPRVTHINEDLLIQGTVGQSVPTIFPSYQSSAYSGAGWTVAILDTGVDKSHPAFGNRVIDEACYSSNTNFSNYYSLCPNSTPNAPIKASTSIGSGVDCQAQLNNLKNRLNISNTDGTDCTHGTGVAGVAAGNFGSTQGVARDVNIIAIQVFTASQDGNTLSVGAFPSDVLKGLERVYALRNTHKIAAVNLSLGGTDVDGNAINTESLCGSSLGVNEQGISATLRPIIQLLKQAGIATIIASGNNDVENGISTYACIREAIAVGATDNNDNKYDDCNHTLQLVLHDSPATNFNGTNNPRSYPTRNCGSNSGDLLDLWAPGVNIKTARAASAGGGTEIHSGTSQAAPHVAGAWAVMKQKNPNATVDDIENAFKTTGQAITIAGVTRQRINIDEALLKIGNTATTQLTLGTTRVISQSIKGAEDQYYVDVPAGANSLTIKTSGGSGDADLYVRFGTEASISTYDCRSNQSSNTESCQFDQPTAGRWYILVDAYDPYSQVNLLAKITIDEDDPNGIIDACQQGHTPVGNVHLAENIPLCLQGATRGDQRQMSFYVNADKAGRTLEIQLSHGSGDGILLHRYDNRPTQSVYDNISDNAGNEETIQINNAQEGWNYIHVQTESAFSGVTLLVRYRDDNTNDDDNTGNSDLVDSCQQGQMPVGNVYLAENIPLCLQGATRGDQRQMSFYVEADKAGRTLEIQLSHGSGNGILLHRYDNRPTRSVYDNISNNAGNEEMILVNNIQEGWNYVHVQTESAFSGVTLRVRYRQN